MSDLIYLDHNATSPILPEVADAIRDTSLRFPGNPESQHRLGQQARRVLEDARETIGGLLGARSSGMTEDRVIFTSGGTEANHLALRGLTASMEPGRFIVSSIEHPCVLQTARQLETAGWEVQQIDADSTGVVSAEDFTAALDSDTPLASLMLANNETGVLQPVQEISQSCREQGILLHTDASQAVGRIPIHFADLNVAALCCAAHKFQGPLGIGVLLLRHDVNLTPTFLGGHQQAGLRPGTETVALAVGMRTALELWHRDAQENVVRLCSLRDQLEQIILAEMPEVRIIGQDAPRLPNTSNISFVGLDRQALVLALDVEGVACSTGSACASGSSEPAPTLLAMGLDEGTIGSALRFSLGTSTKETEVRQAAHRILSVCKRLRQR